MYYIIEMNLSLLRSRVFSLKAPIVAWRGPISLMRNLRHESTDSAQHLKEHEVFLCVNRVAFAVSDVFGENSRKTEVP